MLNRRRGPIVGEAQITGNYPYHAFLYSQGKLQDLNDFIGRSTWLQPVERFCLVSDARTLQASGFWKYRLLKLNSAWRYRTGGVADSALVILNATIGPALTANRSKNVIIGFIPAGLDQ